MKKSDLGFLTQHFEKLVLGLSVLILLGVGAYAWLGVLGDPHAIDGKTAADIRDDTERAADRLRAAMNSTDSELPSPEEHQVEDYATAFTQHYAEPVILADAFAPLDGGGVRPKVNTEGPVFNAIDLPTPPMAESFSIKVKHAVLADAGAITDPQLRQMVAEVQDMVGGQAPVDFQYVSVMTEFPLKDWAVRLDEAGQGSGEAIPDNVWLAKLGVAGVYLVREEQDIDGNWGNRTVVNPLPQQLAFLPGQELPATNPMEAAAVLDTIQQSQDLVTKPLFPPTVEPWTPPVGTDRVFSAAEQEKIKDLEDEISRLQRRLDQLNGVDRQDSRNTRTRTDTRRRASNRGGGGMDDIGGGGLGMDPRGNTRSRDRGNRGTDRDQAERDRQAQQIEGVEEELLEKRRELNELYGLDDDEAASQFLRGRGPGGYGGYPGMGDEMGMDMGMGMGDPMLRERGMGRPGGLGMGRPGLTGRDRNTPTGQTGIVPRRPTDDVPETVRVWAHDLTAQPGKTYRYKLVVAAINPLYQYTRTTKAQRDRNEYRIALPPSEDEIESAPWTTPVTLDPQAYYYFVRGNAEQDRATIEIWKVWNGQWRKAEFEESPGNPVGGVVSIDMLRDFKQDVDMGVGIVLLDIDTVETANATDVRMVYLLPDGRIGSRLLSADRRNDKRTELEEEAERRKVEEDDRFASRG